MLCVESTFGVLCVVFGLRIMGAVLNILCALSGVYSVVCGCCGAFCLVLMPCVLCVTFIL